MKRVIVDKLQVGMHLAEDVIGSSGEVLLHAGLQLDEGYIKRLIALGKPFVNIASNEASTINKEVSNEEKKQKFSVVSGEIKNQAEKLVEEVLNDIAKTGELNDKNVSETKQVVGQIIDEVVKNRVILENLEDYTPVNFVVDQMIMEQDVFENVENLRNYDEYTFVHCVNVCVMATIIGLAFRYDQKSLQELGIGALLHDVGKVKIDKSIINKPGKLTEEERKEIEKHTFYTYEMLRQRKDLSHLSALIAYQHHERYDGYGYPAGLKEKEIHLYSRIVAVADVYDALVTDRSYRPKMHSYEAAEIIQGSSGTHFDPWVVKAFMDNIVIYPIGSPIILSNGARGVVLKTNKVMPARPIILIFYDEKGNHLMKPQKIDLTENLTLFVHKVLA